MKFVHAALGAVFCWLLSTAAIAGVYDYSSTAGSNLSVGGVSIAEGMARASVNNAIRAELADLANLLKDESCSVTTTGSANAYAVSLNSAPTAYADQMVWCATANFSNTGGATMNVNSIGAQNLRKMVAGVATALASGDYPAGHMGVLTYSSANTAIILLNPATTPASTVTGTLPVANGGTGATTLTGVLKGNGTSAFTAAAQGTDYYAPGGTDVAIADGGTGQSTATAAFQALSPLTTQGDMIRGGVSGPERFALGTTGQAIVSNGSLPGWGSIDLANSSAITGTLPVGNGGTGLTGGTSGGIPYYSASNAITSSAALTANRLVLGGGAGAAPTVLGSLGTTTTLLHGNAGGAPTFGAVDLANDATGTLAVGNGGTGLTSGNSGGIPYYSASNALTSSAALTNHAIVVGGGAGAAPSAVGSLGTTTQVLHGAAAGNPTWSAVDLANDVSGNLGVSHLNSGTSASSSTFWRGDGSWATPAGAGNVSGPGSATDNAAVRFDSTTGTVIQNSGVIIDDSNNVSGIGTLSASISTTGVLASLTSTDASATGGPQIDLIRSSASPAASDALGAIRYTGKDSNANNTVYAFTAGGITSPTDTSESGTLTIDTVQSGTLADRVVVGAGVQVGSPTGGDEGAGTVNATGYYINGAQITSGTYTPTITNTTNVDSSSSATGFYQRVGNVVMVSGSVSVDTTSNNTATAIGISLPVASNIAAASDLSGMVGGPSVLGTGATFPYIAGDAANDRATANWTANGTSAALFYFQFQYKVL